MKTEWLLDVDVNELDLSGFNLKEIEYGEINPKHLLKLSVLSNKLQLSIGDFVYSVSCGAYSLHEVVFGE